MKNKTLIILYSVAAFFALCVIIAKVVANAESDSVTKFNRGDQPFENLSPGAVAELELKGADHTATIKIVDGKWVVAERNNYPVNITCLLYTSPSPRDA